MWRVHPLGRTIASMTKSPKTVVPRFKPQRRRTFIREWRKFRGMTQEQLADRLGWSVSNVSQLEQARQGYSQEGLEALAEALDCDVGQLLMVDPTKDDAMWSIWEKAQSGERKMIINVAKSIVKTGTGG